MAASALSLSSLTLSVSVSSSSPTISLSTSSSLSSFPKSSLFSALPTPLFSKQSCSSNFNFHVKASSSPSFASEEKAGGVVIEEEEEEEESPEEIRRAFEDLYGPAFSRLSTKKSSSEEDGFGAAKRGARDRNPKDNMEEKVVQVRRVTKVVKGGKQLSFRAIVVVGDKQGRVGVGVGKAKEVIIAVQKASADARRHLITVPMTKQKTFPHRAEGKFGAAKVMLRPAAIGTGVIAGGSVRIVLEMAGVVNGMGKELGSKNPLNNARAVIEAISGMKQFRDVAEKRGIPMEVLWQ